MLKNTTQDMRRHKGQAQRGSRGSQRKESVSMEIE